MASLEELVLLIYHELQEHSGSLFCAQLALNSLLQGNYFTAADIFRRACNDRLERAYNEETRGQGSFLGNALSARGLHLVRWRSEAVEPHTQLAFLLNRNQHWYTLRRFGHSAENCHWFRLDSSRPSPQWISKTELGVFLQQAERDGYSLFVVVPTDPEVPLPLPRTAADDFASTLEPEPSSPLPASASPAFGGEDVDLRATPESTASATQAESQSCRSDPSIPPNQVQGGNADVDRPTAQPSNISVNETGAETVAEENNVTSSEAPRDVDVEEMRRRRLERFGDLDTTVRQRQRQTRKRPALQAPKRSGRN